jgi:SAM-dependent methyltransferase
VSTLSPVTLRLAARIIASGRIVARLQDSCLCGVQFRNIKAPSIMLEKNFSHVGNFTGYMEIVFRAVQSGKSRQRILDIPAGNGLLSARLRECGHDAVCADINRAQADYVYANLDQPLPFADAEFDTCLCLEGIEHVVDSAALIKEFCRITRPGGRIIISLPNVQNIFSRFQFLCSGYFYQFPPWGNRHLQSGEMIDRGHISPLSYLQLRYLFQNYGARVSGLSGDRWKKKWLIPLALPFLAVGWLWSRWSLIRQKETPPEKCREMLRDLFSAPALFSRSLVLTFEKFPAEAGKR